MASVGGGENGAKTGGGGAGGKLHLPVTYSPEFGKAPDCNFDLALLRWGCQTLLWSCERLKISDPLQPKWPDLVFHNLRAEDSFLVSARRTAGKTLWVRVKSLSGEPCRIKPDLPGDVKIQRCRMNALGNGVFELKLLKGGEALLYSRDTPPSGSYWRLQASQASRLSLRKKWRA